MFDYYVHASFLTELLLPTWGALRKSTRRRCLGCLARAPIPQDFRSSFGCSTPRSPALGHFDDLLSHRYLVVWYLDTTKACSQSTDTVDIEVAGQPPQKERRRRCQEKP